MNPFCFGGGPTSGSQKLAVWDPNNKIKNMSFQVGGLAPPYQGPPNTQNNPKQYVRTSWHGVGANQRFQPGWTTNRGHLKSTQICHPKLGPRSAIPRPSQWLGQPRTGASLGPQKINNKNGIPSWGPSSAAPGAAQSPKQTKTIRLYLLARVWGEPVIPARLDPKPWTIKSGTNLSSQNEPK